MWRPGRDNGSSCCRRGHRCGRGDDDGDVGRFVPVAADIIAVKTTATMSEAFAVSQLLLQRRQQQEGTTTMAVEVMACEAGRRWHATMATDHPVVPPCSPGYYTPI